MKVWQVGDVYRARTGEILEVDDFNEKEFIFKVRDPVTLEFIEDGARLRGPIQNIHKFSKMVGLEKIDLKTYKPTGLVENKNRR